MCHLNDILFLACGKNQLMYSKCFARYQYEYDHESRIIIEHTYEKHHESRIIIEHPYEKHH